MSKEMGWAHEHWYGSPFLSILLHLLTSSQHCRGHSAWEIQTLIQTLGLLGSQHLAHTNPANSHYCDVFRATSSENTGRKVMGGCDVMCWYHMHLVPHSLFQFHLWWKASLLFLCFPSQKQQRIRSRIWNEYKCAHVPCMCACMSFCTCAAQGIKSMIPPRVSHRSSVTCLWRSNFVRQDWFLSIRHPYETLP